MRNFVLVTATCTEPGRIPVTASGIKKLRRGVDMAQFIVDYLNSVGVDEDTADIHKRESTYTAVVRSDVAALSWSFTMYSEDDLISAVSHLTREELLRDIKELLPLKAAE